MPFSTYLPEHMGSIRLTPSGPFVAGAYAELSLPHGLAAAAAILRALPGHAHAAAEIGGREGTRRLHHVGAVQHIEALDRRGADDLGGKPHRHRAGPDDVAHHRLAHLEFFAAS